MTAITRTRQHRLLAIGLGLLPLVSTPTLHAQQAVLVRTLVQTAAQAAGQTPATAPLAAPTGDAARGKTLFDQTLRCYACHGFDGQTGSPRLVPMTRAEDVFLAYVKKPATAGMPSFRDAADRDLRDVYAYIRSIPRAAPEAASIPLLKGIIDRRSSVK